MPARIEQPRAFHAEDTDQVLHDLLQVTMDGIRILALTAIKRSEHIAFSLGDLLIVDCRRSCFAGISGSAQSCTTAEDQQVRERISAEAVCAMQSCSSFTGGEESRQRRSGGF